MLVVKDHELKSTRVPEAPQSLGAQQLQADPWQLIFRGYHPAKEREREALCTLGNGYFATRGAAEEAHAGGEHYPGTYLAGGYDRLEASIGGKTVEHEDLVNWPNWLVVSYRVADDVGWFALDEIDVVSYEQHLDMRHGVLMRSLRYRDRAGRESTINSRRFVHMENQHCAGLLWELVPHNWSGEITVHSALDSGVSNAGAAQHGKTESRHLHMLRAEAIDNDIAVLEVESHQSGIRMAQAARTRLLVPREPGVLGRRIARENKSIAIEYTAVCSPGVSVRLEKVVALFTSRDRAISEPLEEALVLARQAPDFDRLLRSHARAWVRVWRRCDIDLRTDDVQLLSLVRLQLFHLMQVASAAGPGPDAGLSVRGLHGEAYRGHVSWDALFAMPYLDLHMPELSRHLLRYRFSRLPQARLAAQQAGFAGAMFPWRSGSNGREETPRFRRRPGGGGWAQDNRRLQRHINAAVAWNVWHYVETTADEDFLSRYGAELLVEIARFWYSAARYNAQRDRFEIPQVVGPDEFHTRYPGRDTAGIDNDAYTNIMASWCLRRAGEALSLLEAERRHELLDKLGLAFDELARWDEVSRKLFVPFLENGVIAQFEGYEALEDIDWMRYRDEHGESMRLERILAKQGDDINRFKVSKLAGVPLLFYLFSDEELIRLLADMGYTLSTEAIERSIDYYRDTSVNESALSRLVALWVRARRDRTHSFEELRMALENGVAADNDASVGDGIHLGAMAGAVDMILRCYCGLTVRHNTLWLDPCLPEGVSRLRFRVQFRGCPVGLTITRRTVRIAIRERWDTGLRIGVEEDSHSFAPNETRIFRLKQKKERMG